jgi:hypothetical protein
MRKMIITVALFSLCRPAVASAESDAYFCIGEGYLAYETRFSHLPAKHLLHVVRFGPESGIMRLPPILLEDFQVHGMSCRPGAVDLEGWTTGYSVNISAGSRSEVVVRPTAFTPRSSGSVANLGHGAKESVIDLLSEGLPGEFQLVIAPFRASQQVESTTTRLPT